MIESILLTTAQIVTFKGETLLTNASGFFFQRDEQLFLVTSRHVFRDEPSQHEPDRIEVQLHPDPDDLAKASQLSLPLYQKGLSLWRGASDSGGEVDVAAIEINRKQLPRGALYRAFTPQHLATQFNYIDVGSSLLVVGFPLGFHDTLHHLPVVRQAVIASSFGLRFQGNGYFLTDARTHRGISGAPVVMRSSKKDPALGDLPWLILGVHSARLDMLTRDLSADEALGLNCAWYADVLITLTDPPAKTPENPAPKT